MGHVRPGPAGGGTVVSAAMAIAVVLATSAAPASATSPPDNGRAFDPRPLSPAVYGESAPVWNKHQSTYLKGSDGRRLYLEWWLPARKAGGAAPPARVPVVFDITPYEAPNGDWPGYAVNRAKAALVPRGYAVVRMRPRHVPAASVSLPAASP